MQNKINVIRYPEGNNELISFHELKHRVGAGDRAYMLTNFSIQLSKTKLKSPTTAPKTCYDKIFFYKPKFSVFFSFFNKMSNCSTTHNFSLFGTKIYAIGFYLFKIQIKMQFGLKS